MNRNDIENVAKDICSIADTIECNPMVILYMLTMIEFNCSDKLISISDGLEIQRNIHKIVGENDVKTIFSGQRKSNTTL